MTNSCCCEGGKTMLTKTVVTTILIVAGLNPVLAGVFLLAQSQPFDFFASNRLVAFCLIGSSVGALVAVSARLGEADTNTLFLRQSLLKFATSLLSGACVSPYIIERYADRLGTLQDGIPTPAVVLAVSAVISSVAILLFNILGPLLAKRSVDVIKQVLPIDPSQGKQND